MRTRPGVRTALLAVGLAVLLAACGGQGSLPVVGEAPDFTLRTIDGAPFHLHDDTGAVRLISFIYTNCPTECPAMTHWMLAVQKKLKADGVPPEKVRFYSITFDPEKDTPEAMRAFLERFRYDGETLDWPYWRALTGSPEETRGVVRAFGLLVQPSNDGLFIHSDRVVLVDGEGKIRALYPGSTLPVDDVYRDMKRLIR
ncbi:MAG: SCO family protein [Hydrogenibacillus schlegelii]|nr:SCO family protein [Hydrogenibacillus schlegelii]